MPKHKQKRTARKSSLVYYIKLFAGWLGLDWPKSSIARKLLIALFVLVFVVVGIMYGTAQWYINKHKNEPVTFGATFVSSYAKSFGLDPKETFSAIVDDLGVKKVRLVSYWSIHEPKPGKYDFSDLDWQFKKAEKENVKVSLAIGLRQPRWPECHMPEWASGLPKDQWSARLKDYMAKVIDRYKDSPSLESYQLENEFFLSVFGICPDFSRERLIDEYNFVKQLDSEHPVIISRSNNAMGLPLGEPRPDSFAVSVYKRVWDKTLTKRYIEYPFPAWFYASLAGGGEILTGKNLFIHELQSEAWLPDKPEFKMNDISSIAEQNKSLSADRLADRIDYGVATGMKRIDLWGVEWWYWRKAKANDPSLWETAKVKIEQHNNNN